MRSAPEVCGPCWVERIGIAANLRVALDWQCRRSEQLELPPLLGAIGMASEDPVSQTLAQEVPRLDPFLFGWRRLAHPHSFVHTR